MSKHEVYKIKKVETNCYLDYFGTGFTAEYRKQKIYQSSLLANEKYEELIKKNINVKVESFFLENRDVKIDNLIDLIERI